MAAKAFEAPVTKKGLVGTLSPFPLVNRKESRNLLEAAGPLGLDLPQNLKQPGEGPKDP